MIVENRSNSEHNKEPKQRGLDFFQLFGRDLLVGALPFNQRRVLVKARDKIAKEEVREAAEGPVRGAELALSDRGFGDKRFCQHL